MIARALAAAAALAAALPAHAYVRSCATNDAGQEVCFYWPGRSIAWKLNPPSAAISSPSCTADAVLAAAQSSFAAWTQATRSNESAPCDQLALPYGGTTSSIAVGIGSAAEHIVVFRQGFCSNDTSFPADDPCRTDGTCGNTHNCFDDAGALGQNTIALTTVSYSPSSGKIGDADIEVVDWNGQNRDGSLAGTPDGWYFTCQDPAALPNCTAYGQTGCVYMDLQNTLTHEAGHFIGLNHPPVAEATMYGYAQPGTVDKRSLADDDVNGVCAIYPPVKKSSSGGCGVGDPAAIPALLLAIAALAPRLRRSRGSHRTTIPA